MASRRTDDETPSVGRPPASTPEGRQNQLVNLAVDLAEKQLRDGTAATPVIVHYMKLASQRESLELQKLQGENSLLQAKIESMASAKRVEELYEDAIGAMRAYGGHETVEQDDDDD